MPAGCAMEARAWAAAVLSASSVHSVRPSFHTSGSVLMTLTWKQVFSASVSTGSTLQFSCANHHIVISFP